MDNISKGIEALQQQNEIAAPTQRDAYTKAVSENLEQLAQEAEANGLPWYLGLFNSEILKIAKENAQQHNQQPEYTASASNGSGPSGLY